MTLPPPRRPSLRATLLVVLLLAAIPATATDLPTPHDLLARSIAHHDPDGLWGTVNLVLGLEESRPDGLDRRTMLYLSPERQGFAWLARRDGRLLEGVLGPVGCELRLDGSPDISAAEAEELGLTCDELERRRDYYTYLWGLPMKLRDPGTELGPVERAEYDGAETLAIRVAYEEPVGSDVWYFYFDPATAALVGYRFHHDEAAGDGEYVLLEGEERVGSMRLPKERAWYTHQGDGHLGTDTLVTGRVVR